MDDLSKTQIVLVGATMADIASAPVVYLVPPKCLDAGGQSFRSWTVLEVHIGQDTAGLELDALSNVQVRVVSSARRWLDTVCASLRGIAKEILVCDVSKAAAWTATMTPQEAFEGLTQRGVLRRVIAEHCEPWTENKPQDSNSIDIESAGKFLSHVFPDVRHHVFQTFTDNKTKRRATKNDPLARELTGTLEQGASNLSYLMSQGAGVFFTVNETRGLPRKAANVCDTRNVLYADMDGMPLSHIDALDLKPHAIVNSSPGKYQVYWRVDKLPLEQFSNLIERIAVAVGGDVNVKTVERVMRLPGSLHQKGEPHFVTWRDGGATRIYALEEFIGALEKAEKAQGIVPQEKNNKSRQGVREGTSKRLSQDHLTRALDLIPNDKVFEVRDDWVAFGHAVYGASGGEDWGCELFADWTEKGVHDPAGAYNFWSSANGASVRSGAGFIRFHLERIEQEGGNNSAAVAALLHDMKLAAAQLDFADGSSFPEDIKRRPRVELICASSIKPIPISWLWPGWLAEGKLHLFAGASTTGKTTVALRFAAAFSTGGLWPDGTRADNGNVVIWSGEDDVADTLAPRLIAMNADMSRIHFVKGVSDGEKSRAFDPAIDIKGLGEAIETIGGARMLIIDPLVSAVRGDAHRNNDVRRALEPLVALAEQHRAALIGITHFSKNTQGRKVMDRVNGSVAFHALARITFAFVKEETQEGEPEPKRKFVRGDSNIGPSGGGFEYAIREVDVPGHSIRISVAYFEKPISGSAEEILADAEAETYDRGKRPIEIAKDFLKDTLSKGPIKADDIWSAATAERLSEGTVKRAKSLLGVVVEKEKGVTNGPWVWRLKSPGERAAADFSQLD